MVEGFYETCLWYERNSPLSFIHPQPYIYSKRTLTLPFPFHLDRSILITMKIPCAGYEKRRGVAPS